MRGFVLLLLLAGVAAGAWWLLRDRPRPPAPRIQEPRVGPAEGEPAGRAHAESIRPQPAPAEATTVTGRVLDALDRPLPGAEVVVQAREESAPLPAPEPNSTALARTRTDTEGRFSLRHRAGRLATAVVTHPEYPPQIVGEVELPRGELIDLGDIRLQSQPGLRVDVFADGAGLAVPGARVELAPALDDAMLPGYPLALRRRLAQTDRDGSAMLLGVEPGEYDLRVSAPGYATQRRRHVQPETRLPPTVRILLAAGAILRGRLRAGPEPVAAGHVLALPIPDGAVVSARSNEHGEFRLEGLAPGSYRIEAFSARHGRLDLPRLDVGPDPEPVDLDFGMGEALSGQVLGEDGAPVAGAELTAQAELGELQLEGRLARTTSGPDGAFTLSGLAATEHRILVRARGWPEQEFGPWPPGPTPRILLLTPGLRVTGQVFGPYGQPLAGATVKLVDAGQDGSEFAAFLDRLRGSPPEVLTGSDGRFEIRGAPALPWRVVVRGDGQAPAATGMLPVPPDRWLEVGPIRIPQGAWVRGHARRADGGPAARVRACLDPVPAPDGPWREALSALTDAAGNFAVGPAAPGDYELSFFDPGSGDAAGAADLRQRSRVRLRLEPGSQLQHDLQERPR